MRNQQKEIKNKCVDCGIETDPILKIVENVNNYNCQPNYQVIYGNKVYCSCCVVNAQMRGDL